MMLVPPPPGKALTATDTPGTLCIASAVAKQASRATTIGAPLMEPERSTTICTAVSVLMPSMRRLNTRRSPTEIPASFFASILRPAIVWLAGAGTGLGDLDHLYTLGSALLGSLLQRLGYQFTQPSHVLVFACL